MYRFFTDWRRFISKATANGASRVANAGSGVRQGPGALLVPGSDADKREDRAAARLGDSGHDVAGYGEGPNAVVKEAKVSPSGKSYADTISEDAGVARTPVQINEPRERRVTIVGDANRRRHKE